MSLFVRLNCNFFTHRKTAKLRLAIGDDALWLPPRLWTYAAEHHPDGNLPDYSAEELAMQLGYFKDASKMLKALIDAGFLDQPPLRIHGWMKHNAYHQRFSERGKKGADARWKKEKVKGEEIEKRGEELSIQEAVQQAPPISLSASEKISAEKELSRVERAIKQLKDRAGDSMSHADRLRLTDLKERQNELRISLNWKA